MDISQLAPLDYGEISQPQEKPDGRWSCQNPKEAGRIEQTLDDSRQNRTGDRLKLGEQNKIELKRYLFVYLDNQIELFLVF